MKILHILDHSVPLHSGYSFRTLSILKEQRALGWETVQLTTPRHTLPGSLEEEVDGFKFYRCRPARRLFGRLPVVAEGAFIAATAQRLEEVARVERPDILHAHSPVLNALAALWVGRKLGLPTVYEVRAFWEDAAVDLGTATPGGLRYRSTRAVETFALRQSDAVTTICEGLRSDMLSRGIAAKKITVIPNAVDHTEFAFSRASDAGLRRRLDLDGKTVLGFIGSFYAYEGLDLLVRALPRLRSARPDLAVLLVGGGPMEQSIKALAEELAVEDLIRFVGRVPHNEVQGYYGLVDLFVYPRHSQRLTELVTPLKPLEAMARGGIVLASDVGGHRELVRDRETGFFFAADDVEALAKTTLDLLARSAEWPGIRAAARHFVESERTWRGSVARYAEIYDRVTASSRNRAARGAGQSTMPSCPPDR
jgi:PEP-CTERM/exosortase A-associated glycosyltransferase